MNEGPEISGKHRFNGKMNWQTVASRSANLRAFRIEEVAMRKLMLILVPFSGYRWNGVCPGHADADQCQ